MGVILQADYLGKKYTLSHSQKQPYYAFRDVMADVVKRWTNRISHPISYRSDTEASREQFWALQDASFKISEGERVGIIGRNGAGKSTLLKILSRIVEPTTGRVTIKGRVASLLEVGTGFHPELTGRENIFLNGAILGMTKAEIKRKFDAIVDFAEVDKFLDTPVKRFSSGMYVRLAFAVAAYLEQEILLIDEVLAVGDAQFQKKCLAKMNDVSRAEGRTVLFVSHNMGAIRQLCKRTIYLSGGHIVQDDASDIVIANYIQNIPSSAKIQDVVLAIARLQPDPAIRLLDVSIRQDGRVDNNVITGKPIEIIIRYEVTATTYGLRVYFGLYDNEETYLFRSFAHNDDEEIRTMAPGRYLSTATIPADLLAPIRYKIGISASIYNVRRCFSEDLLIDLHVHDQGRIKNAYAHNGRIGVKLAPLIFWRTDAD